MMLTRPSKEYYLSAFTRDYENGSGGGAAWLRELRRSALRSFEKVGFPTPKREEWKYTSVEPITSVRFEQANGSTRPPSAEEILAASFADAASNRLVFVNGVCSDRLSHLRAALRARVASLAQIIADDSSAPEPYLGRYAAHEEEGFVALNTAFAQDGAFVFVPRGAILEPIYLIFVFVDTGKPVVAYPRNLLVFEEGCAARVVETYIGLTNGKYFNDAVTEIVAQGDAIVDYYRLQREGANGLHVGRVAAHLSRNANFSAHAITLGGALVRNEVTAVLDGEGAQCALNGLYLVDGERHVDNYTRIDHLKPHGTSTELYKGILSGKSRGIFNGQIMVHKNAQKTDARQTNRNLLLSPEAVVNTKPQLEIYADDVKCSHGSTIGQLDRDAFFYLRSRGLDVETARSLLSYAFASEVIQRVKIPSLRRCLDDYLLTVFARTERN